MSLDVDKLSELLYPRPVRYFETIGSTNDEALGWLQADAPTGAVVVADEQTKGRGRLGRTWFSPPGTALMFSVILHPPSAMLHRVSMLGGLAVVDALDGLQIEDVGIKYPNDVQLGRKKVCGILPEAAWNGDDLAGVVLGIGVNVRVDFYNTPFADTATSLESVTGARVERSALLKRILDHVERRLHMLESDAFFEAWVGRLNMIGARVNVNGIDGIAESVAQDGALLIRDAAGTAHRVIAGDIALGSNDSETK